MRKKKPLLTPPKSPALPFYCSLHFSIDKTIRPKRRFRMPSCPPLSLSAFLGESRKWRLIYQRSSLFCAHTFVYAKCFLPSLLTPTFFLSPNLTLLLNSTAITHAFILVSLIDAQSTRLMHTENASSCVRNAYTTHIGQRAWAASAVC